MIWLNKKKKNNYLKLMNLNKYQNKIIFSKKILITYKLLVNLIKDLLFVSIKKKYMYLISMHVTRNIIMRS